jgi:L-threonylcarbamoyladenylate synthase
VYLDGGPSAGGKASTIVDLTGDAPRLLRQGAISIGRLREIAGVRAGGEAAR